MLKKLRLKKGISLSFVANKLSIDRATFRKVENKESSLRVDWIPTLSELYGVDNEFILNEYLKEMKFKTNDKCRDKLNKKIR